MNVMKSTRNGLEKRHQNVEQQKMTDKTGG